MQLVQYLMCVATRHEQAKLEHEEELHVRQKQSRSGRPRFTLTYQNEIALLQGVIASIRGRPICLKKLSAPALAALAYLLRSKMANEPFTEGHEIITSLVYDPEQTIVYLNSFAELQRLDWIRIIDSPGAAFTDQPPFSWLQACIELGETFHSAMGVTAETSRAFQSNDAYLDAVFVYLQAIIQDKGNLYQVQNPETDLASWQPEGWFRRIALRMQTTSTSALPAAATIEKYRLSIVQHLTLAGLLGAQDGDVQYDFSDPVEVTRLFARGRMCRQQMKQHLFGEKSPLLRQRLVTGTQGAFGETVRLTPLGIKALHGKRDRSSAHDLKSRVKKNTMFDVEEPKVKQEALLLPAPVMDAFRSLIFSESRYGRSIRKSWHQSLPSAWGSPTGSTVLLYGPPGTGKTLAAQYLASELKLPLLKIDAARVLSCWVGESEQNVRRIFDDYTMLHKELGAAPVLLLNEADQLLGARGGAQDGADRMNNNMQNLFLEGLERFDGILVATTNRRDLLDEAFSRRFTYKLELPVPDRALRMALWQSHLPLDRLAVDVDIGALADLNLSGGEIRLVIERAVRLLAYRGVTVIDHKTLVNITREELASRMKRTGSANSIGFSNA